MKGDRYELVLGSQISISDQPCLVERQLGRGGNGTVYLVRSLHDQRAVALKVSAFDATDPDQVAHYRGAAADYQREAQIAKGPGLVKSKLHYFRDETGRDTIGLTMPVASCSVAQDMRRPTPTSPKGRIFTDEQIAGIAQQAAGGLQSLHEQQLVHRDVKPENLLIFNHGRPDQRVMLSDFGSARPMGARATPGGTTPGFERPEQRAFDQIPPWQRLVSAKDDTYALGAAMFEISTKTGPPAVRNRQAVIALPFGRMRTVIETACLKQDLDETRVQLCGFEEGAKSVELNRRVPLLRKFLSAPQDSTQLEFSIARNMQIEEFANAMSTVDRTAAMAELRKREVAALKRLDQIHSQTPTQYRMAR